MSEEFSLRSWLSLALIPDVGGAAVRRLLKEFESPGRALAQSSAALSQVLPRRLAQRVAQGADAKRVNAALRWAEGRGRRILALNDADYPELLKETFNPPTLLYVEGRTDIFKMPCIAVVGARAATPGGLVNAEAFSRKLSEDGVAVVSGLAQGIDAAAHRGALAGGGHTVAVFGTGIDIIYPAEHRKLAAEIAERGALVSDFALGTRPSRGLFPSRNRIINGLCKGCLVVEARKKSGALLTAEYAYEENRELFAVPGSINDPMYRGCHILIKEKGAKLTEDVDDIYAEIGVKPKSKMGRARKQGESAENALLAAVDFGEPTSLDIIAARSGLPIAEVSAGLLDLELRGAVVSVGGRYQRVQ